MKKILALSILLACCYDTAWGDSCATGLMPVFTAAQAKKMCSTFSAGTIGTIANDTYATARNAANSANLNIWKADSSDNTLINGTAAKDIILQMEGDANRKITFDAGSDTALSMRFGDGTAAQVLSIGANTTDASDDAKLQLMGGAAFGNGRGAVVRIAGNEATSTGGGIDLLAGDTTTGHIVLSIENASAAVFVKDTTSGNLWKISDAGDMTFYAASAKIIPGATSLVFRNAADNATNLTIVDAGTATFRGVVVAPAGVQYAAAVIETVAAGTGSQGDGPLTAGKFFHLVTGFDETKVATLPACATANIGEVHFILNDTTNKFAKIFPASGGAINSLGANNAYTQGVAGQGGKVLLCACQAANQWYCA